MRFLFWAMDTEEGNQQLMEYGGKWSDKILVWEAYNASGL
jgi:hypothetical protein